MTTYDEKSIDSHAGNTSPQMVSTETQTLTWNELTLQMVSDIVSHQVIQMNKQKVDSLPDALQSSCEHLKGMVWKDIADMIVCSHNVLCAQTGVKLVDNVVRITVDWPQSVEDHVKPSVEVHIFPQAKNVETMDCVDSQMLNSELGGISKDSGVNTEKNTITGKADNVHPKQTVCDSEENSRIATDIDGGSVLYTQPDKDNSQEKDLCIENVDLVENESKESCKDLSKDDRTKAKETSVESETCTREEVPQKFRLRKRTRNSNKCDEHCGKECKTVSESKCHSQTHVSQEVKKEPGFKCNVCQKVFQSQWKLNKHKPIHAPNRNVHPCPHCEKICKTVQSLKRHQRIHVVAPSYYCEDCGATFRVQMKLKRHRIKEHNVVEKHTCNVCGAVYKNETTLKDHLVEHTGKEFLCDICGKKFRRPELLRCHRFRHGVKSKPKSFKCPMCPKAYYADSPLKIHIRLTHMKERENVCRICGKKFFYHYQMVAHEQAHDGIMQHVCKYCNRGFLKKASLVTHEMVHTGDKPYKCSHCSKGFATNPHRIRHEKIHTDTSKPDRVFQCKTCSASFRYKGQCVEHEKRHAGVKDHTCEFCNKGFVSRGDLIRHLRTHTAGKPHKCKHCDMAFSKRKELLVHEGSHGLVKAETIQNMHVTSTS